MASTATSSRLGARHNGCPNSAGVCFRRHQQQDSTIVGKEGWLHSPWVDGGVVAGLVQRTRDGEEGVRGVEVPACFPARLPPTTLVAPSTKSRSAPPPPPHSRSPTLPPLLFLRWRTGKGQNPNATWPEGGAWPPGCRLGQSGARARTRRTLVGWRGGFPDVVAPQLLESSLLVWRGKGRGVFSPWGDPEACARARPSSACVPAGGLPVPSRAHAGAVRWGAARCEGEREKVRRKKRGRG
jgi:hypothetical protein